MKAIGCRQNAEFQARMKRCQEESQRLLEQHDKRVAMRLAFGEPLLNASKKKRGGVWFLKLGRFNIQFSISKKG